ncbi:putative 1-aminocyclopropane-1-carboxylate deaminase [Xylariomycetidae sp. FL2044]|nr:putative 1-aminocyclopropane-1-carboxylate deaminase [Xylariomycetidae sp. FL2044]
MAADLLQLPEPFASIPRESFLFGPSPIQHLPRISEALSGGKVQVYAKREDCNSGLAYGGNKTRKLEYLASEALAHNCDTLVSIGGVQSNHTRQVSAVAAKLGLSCALVQEHWVDGQDDDAHYSAVGNIQLSRLMGADARLDPLTTFGIEHKPTLAALESELRARGKKPYYIPAGASDHPLGGLGFARWAFEVDRQEREMGLFFDTVVVCAVTGSTMAGMVAGFKLLDRIRSEEDKNKNDASSNPRGKKKKQRKIIGIDASAKPQQTFDQILRIARATGSLIGLGQDNNNSKNDNDNDNNNVTAADIILDDRYHAGVYGIPDEATLEAMRFGARTEAFITDPVYEGKSLAGMMDMIRRGEIAEGSTVLYAHLGGQVALNAYSSIQ